MEITPLIEITRLMVLWLMIVFSLFTGTVLKWIPNFDRLRRLDRCPGQGEKP